MQCCCFFPLFYSFTSPCIFYFILCFVFFVFFEGKKLKGKTEQIPHSLRLCGSYLWVVQFSLSDRRYSFSLTDLMAASQYDQLKCNSFV